MNAGGEIAAAKAALRIDALARLRAMSREDRAQRSGVICRNVLALAAWQQATNILLFSPMRSEPDIAPLAVDGAKTFATIPVTFREEVELQLTFTPDLILVPGLAFSNEDHRLGRGGGVYDRLLDGRARNAFKLAVCFAFQKHARIPVEPHDVIMDAVISD